MTLPVKPESLELAERSDINRRMREALYKATGVVMIMPSESTDRWIDEGMRADKIVRVVDYDQIRARRNQYD